VVHWDGELAEGAAMVAWSRVALMRSDEEQLEEEGRDGRGGKR
jgi:hypothetical protein